LDAENNIVPCCVCEKVTLCRHIVMLAKRGSTPGKGWGCFVCKLPNDGATAVICDECREALQYQGHDKAMEAIKCWCVNGLTKPERAMVSDLSEAFNHDLSKHPECAGELASRN
jgi:hypothetical protein